jgi:hypothetical protein
MMAVRHPELVRRVATYSATFSAPPSTLEPSTTRYERPQTAETDHILFQRESYKKVAPDPGYWPRIYENSIIKHFLEKPDAELPLATAELGYHPGKTR